MRILHTSDWHIGRSLYGKSRYEECLAFLEWLIKIINQEKVDALLVSGDIFDTGNPSNRAQQLYYSFLFEVSKSCCRHIVIIAGNHDSPTFLNAPKELLKILNVYVVGTITDTLEDEVIVLDIDKQAKAIICAVPYLRDRDIRIAEAGETIDDKNAKLIKGIATHYADVCQIAEKKRAEINKANIPIIAMGHLFTAGGKTTDGDGVRELYIGSLNRIHVEKFPQIIDYLALGHLHIPQIVNKQEKIRYSGSPIPMGFGEAKQKKIVIIVEFNETKPTIREVTVPTFQQLVRIVGDVEEIKNRITELKEEGSQAWLEIEYNGSEFVANLREIIEELIAGSKLEFRKIKNKQIAESVSMSTTNNETLDDLDENEVFKRCLDTFQVAEEKRIELLAAYGEILKEIKEADSNAE